MPGLCIAVPAYNAGLYIGATLESILVARIRDSEIIVLDDGSKDNTVEICSRIAREYSRIVNILSQENTGDGAAGH